MTPVNERQPALPYRTTADLESQLDHVRSAPADAGAVRLVVRRPDLGVREILEEGRFDPADGLVGDTWLARARSRAIADGRHFDAQVNVMSARMVALLADTVHNVGDALTAVPLGVAFLLLHRGRSPRLTYGWGRAEDFASSLPAK